MIENLDIIMSGPLAPNPTELLASAKFLELMRRLKNDYNYIIIDSPPASHLTDPVVLARHVDFVLLVASKYTSKLKIVQENYTNLKNINKNIALIINRVEQSKYSYRYYYDYRYGEDSSEMSSNVSKPRRIFRKA